MPIDKPLSPQGYNIGVDPINTNPFFDGVPGGGGGEGVTAYNQLTGRPFINGKVLEGNKDLNLVTPEELQAAKTELTSSVTKEEEARIAEDAAIRQEIETISLTPGPPGSDGAPGAPGNAATIRVGATETVEPGTPASVTNSGTENAAVLTFKIPRGNTGAPGPAGADGVPGKDFTYEDFTPEQLEALRGPQGNPGVPGSDGAPGVAGRIESVSAETVPYTEKASVQNTGTEENAILHFKIPQGIPGTSGGAGGATVTVNVGTTTTGEPGTNAEVTNRGTEENVVLDFKIPRGNTGAPGADGTPGKDFTYEDFTSEQLEALRGPQGIQGVPGSDGAPGVDGKAATIRVGTVTTLPAGSDATVTNSGTENTAILNFGIPQGIQGEPGSGGGGGGVITASRKTQSMNFSNATPSEISGGWRITIDASAEVNDVLDNRLVLAVTGNYIAGSYVNFNVIWSGGTDGSQLVFDSQKNVYVLVRIYRSGFSGSRIFNVEVTGVTGTITAPSSAVSGTFYVQWLSIDSNARMHSAMAATKNEKIILRDGE